MPAHKYNQFNGLIMNNKAKFVLIIEIILHSN